jgi:hypothetical protein
MFRSLLVTIRTLGIFAFLLAMPLLALPPVANWAESVLSQMPNLLDNLASNLAATLNLAAPATRPRDASPLVGGHRTPAEAAGANSAELLIHREALPASAHGFMGQPGVETATRSESAAVPASTPVRHTPDQHVAVLSARLEQLGARNFTLEPFDARRFRFRCEVPLADDSVYSKPFEAIDADAVGAIRLVEAAVVAWRSGSAAGSPAPR